MGEQRDYSNEVAEQIDSEVASIVKKAQERARETLSKYRQALDNLTALLLEKETITGQELTGLLQKDTGIEKPDLPSTGLSAPALT